ncbi:ParB/RepB/Spo0J family partition protein [Pseudobutyrivibrio xylanivorans]|uniref:ParB/RepB/Spo0J family partition protein n=1 Tax=Pseudobutyrivibrio xylanivorans TaxID=185007 RepID=A0A5P6VP15_PSEXY|nr:ParB/RepB/Spo0J family partition protein [Pseudobutyrivibrio xylanivorans]QFJ54152.1 ParB/RepB/Spo0J family partition protein [Pseudobutyrivibrio xylanivorans]
MAAKREKIHFASVEELLGAPTETGEGTVELKLSEIYGFESHPFKVIDDDKMEDLVQSIKENGVLTPVIVRPDDEGTYEMISGHRRFHAASRAGLNVIPAIIKPMTNDEAVVAMVDANVQREEILPSERAWSLKMKMDAMRRQGARNDLTSRTQCGKSSAAQAGEAFGLKERQVQKYIRLTNLVEELLELVDNKKLTMGMAVDISYFDKQLQEWIYEYITENGAIKPEQIAMLKAKENTANIGQEAFIQEMDDAVKVKKKSKAVSLSERKLDKYFPYKTSAAEREKVIIELLEKWKKEQEGA